MTSSFQPASLEPIQQTNYGDSARGTQQELNTALDPLFQSQQENDNRRVQNASVQDNSMEQAFKGFAEMSSTLSSLVQEETKRRKEDRIAELKASVLEGDYNQDDLTTYHQYKDQTTAEKNKRDEAGAKARLAGASYEATSRIRSLKRWEQEIVVGLLTQQLMAGKEDRLTSRFATDNETLIALPDGTRMTPAQARAEGTPAQQKAMRAILAKEDLKSTGLIGVADHILADKGLQASLKADLNIDASNTRVFNINDSEKRLELARAELRLTGNPNLWRKRTVGLETSGGTITYAMSMKMFWEEIERLRTPGVDENNNPIPALMSDTQYRSLLNTRVEGDSKGQTWGERFKPQIRQMDNRIATAKLQAYNANKAQIEMEFDEEQRKALLDIPLNERNNASLQYVIDGLARNPKFAGLRPTRLERYMAENSVDAIQKRAIDADVLRSIENNTWSMSKFRRLPASMQTDFYRQKAEEGEALINPQVSKLRESLLTKFITTKTGNLPEKWNHTAEFLKSEFGALFDTKVKEYFQSGKFTLNGAAQQAMKEIEDAYNNAQKDPNSRYFRSAKGFVNLLPKSQQAKSSAAATVAFLKGLDSDILRVGPTGLGSLAGKYVTKDELTKSSQGFGTPYWKPAGPAAYVADKLGMSLVDVHNIWARELGAPEVGKSKGELTFDRTVSPAAKRYMLQHKTSQEIQTRTLNGPGYQPDFVPNNMGEHVQQVAQQNNVEPSLLAALAEKNGTWEKEAIQALGGQLGLLREQKGGSLNEALAALGGFPNADDPDFKSTYLTPVLKSAVKYGGKSVLRGADLMRPGMYDKVQAVTGNSGISTGPHADLRIWSKSQGRYIDPTSIIDQYVFYQGKPIGKTFSVSSKFGPRKAPTAGASTYHQGVDYRTPMGTGLDIRGKYLGTDRNTGAGGNIMRYALTDDLELRVLHT